MFVLTIIYEAEGLEILELIKQLPEGFSYATTNLNCHLQDAPPASI